MPTPPPTMPSDRQIVRDEQRFCISCGYTLYALPLSGSCPECETPVLDSLSDLRQYHAARKMASGLAWLVVSWLAKVGVPLVLYAVVRFPAVGHFLPLDDPRLGNFVLVCSQILVLLPLAIGVYQVTTPLLPEQRELRPVLVRLVFSLYLFILGAVSLFGPSLEPFRFARPFFLVAPFVISIMPVLLAALVARHVLGQLGLQGRGFRLLSWSWVGLYSGHTLLNIARNVVPAFHPAGAAYRWPPALIALSVCLIFGTAVLATVFLLGCRREALRHSRGLG